jgi:hypothetical protein
MNERMCPECGKALPQDTSRKRIYHEACAKERQRAYVRAWQQTERGKQVQREAQRRYRAAHPARKALSDPSARQKIREYQREYRRRVRSGKPPEYWEAYDRRKAQRKAGIPPAKQEPVRLSEEEQALFQQAKQAWNNRRHRVYRKRRKGQMLCYQCERLIPQEKLRKHPRQQFCCPSCAYEDKRQRGYFHRLSKYGRRAQKSIQEQTGHAPGYGARQYHFDALPGEDRRVIGRFAAQSHWRGHEADPRWKRNRVYYWKRRMRRNEHVMKALRASLDESYIQGLGEEDAQLLAALTISRIAREEGLIGEELPPEWNTAAMGLVKEQSR